jgi:hypothetical protein
MCNAQERMVPTAYQNRLRSAVAPAGWLPCAPGGIPKKAAQSTGHSTWGHLSLAAVRVGSEAGTSRPCLRTEAENISYEDRG